MDVSGDQSQENMEDIEACFGRKTGRQLMRGSAIIILVVQEIIQQYPDPSIPTR